MPCTPSPSDLGINLHAWRSGQEHMIDVTVTSEKRAVAVCAPTGFGKSAAVVAGSLISKEPTCIVTASRGLQDQYTRDFAHLGLVDIRGRRNYQCQMREDYTCEEGHVARCPYKGTVACPSCQAEMRAATSSLVVTNYAKWCSARKYGQGMSHFTRVVFDEGHCFVRDTKIRVYRNYRFEDVPIQNIQPGDTVTSFRPFSPAYLPCHKVKEVHKFEAEKILRLKFSDGSSLTCTPNHPIFTTRGWIRADKIDSIMLCLKHGKHDCSLRHLWPIYLSRYPQQEILLQEVRQGRVQSKLRLEARNPYCKFRNARGSSTEDASPKPHEESRVGGEDESKDDRGLPILKRGEWAVNSYTEDDGGSSWVGDRSSYRGQSLEAWISQELQGGYWESVVQGSNRDRREDTLWAADREGSQEDYFSYWVRLESVEVYESTDPDRFREVCPDGYVYDLSVEGDHAYIADDFIVHNSAFDALSDAMQVILNVKEVTDKLKIDFPEHTEDMNEWKAWAPAARAIAEDEMIKARNKIEGVSDPKPAHVRHFTHMRNLARRLAILSTCRAKDWIVEEIFNGFQFDPIRPGRYAESALLLKVPKLVFVSATLRPKSLHMVGISKDQFDFIEFDSDFDPQRAPIYYVPTMRVDSRNPDRRLLWAMFDRVASRRRDRKGIVQTTSYDYQREVSQVSRFSPYMILNPKGEAPTEMIDIYRDSPPGYMLVSPSVSTGYDFPGRQCEWQFFVKLPFEPPSKIQKARSQDDPEYSPYRTMNNFVQRCGRGMRSKNDQCENFIGDDHMKWFYGRYRYLAPKWFHNFYKEQLILPPPPERL